MKLSEKDIIRFDGKEKLNRAQTLTALHNYAMKKMGISKVLESPVNIYYYTTEEYEQEYLNSIKDFFKAMEIAPEECKKYSIKHNINDEKMTPLTFFFDETGELSAIITKAYNENYGKNATNEAIGEYIQEQGLNK